jgi:lysophospholipase L1-like esterase
LLPQPQPAAHASLRAPRSFARYVALGDSSAEGLDDPDGAGGYRGWADRLAERLAASHGAGHRASQGGVSYANLAIRGRRTRQIVVEQLAAAVAMRPDLATVFCGTNDVIAASFDLPAVAADVERLHRALIGAGATVLTFTLPDLSPVLPLARRLAPRVAALNEALRRVAAASGALLVDVAAHPVASDPRLWSDDRLHANAAGHARIAAALAQALGLPGSDASWSQPLPAPPPRSRRQRAAAEVAWLRRHFLPWAWGHLRGRSSGAGRSPKRPTMEPLGPPRDGRQAAAAHRPGRGVA